MKIKKQIILILMAIGLTFSVSAASLSDAKATDNAKKLFKYLNDVNGKYVITGQMENAWNNNCNMLERVYKDTGKYPALMGFDFMNYTSMGYNSDNKQTDRANRFWNGKNFNRKKISDVHGIVSFMWHWRDPSAPSGTTGEFNADKTSFRIPYDTNTHSWKKASPEYNEIIKDFDTICAELQKLQDADIPVIWRPMHEAAGNLGLYGNSGVAWFWWGAGNETTYNKTTNKYSVSNKLDTCAECYVELWKLMYTYFTETKGIHNLIWVWNGQNEKFYPGSKYVDIIGDDIYPNPKDYSSQKNEYAKYKKIDSSKIVALTECGVIPTLENMKKDNSIWSFFMVWNDGNSEGGNVSTNTHKDNFWSGDYHNPADHKKAVYESDLAITLDKLPDLTAY